MFLNVDDRISAQTLYILKKIAWHFHQKSEGSPKKSSHYGTHES